MLRHSVRPLVCGFESLSGLPSTLVHGRHLSSPPSPFPERSFIGTVKAAGASALLGLFINTGDRFDACLKGMRVTHIGDGECTCELPVEKSLCNAYGTLHGGASCTVVDVVGTIALLTVAPTKPGVSLEINTSFVSAAKEGSVVVATGKVLKAGKRVAFTTVDLRVKDTGALVVTGRHTKAL